MIKYLLLTSLLFFSVDTLAAEKQCRNASVKHAFDVNQGYPKGRFKEGYKVDHICALACGGLDIITNMQYQTFLESDEKDKWERTAEGCKKTCNSSNSLPYRTVFNCK